MKYSVCVFLYDIYDHRQSSRNLFYIIKNIKLTKKIY